MITYNKPACLLIVVLVAMGFAISPAHCDDNPSIKASWSLDGKSIVLKVLNQGSKPIQISPMGDFRAMDISNIGITDLSQIGFIQHGTGIVNANIIFFMKGAHPELSSSSRGGQIPSPKVIAPGEQGAITFPLDGNFLKVATYSDRIRLLLTYNGQILDVVQLYKDSGGFTDQIPSSP